MRARQQPRLEGAHAAGERAFQVQCADDAVLGGAQRQIHDRHRHARGLHPPRPAQRAAGNAIAAARPGIAMIAAAFDHPHVRKQGSQRPHGSGFSGAAVAQHQHAAQSRIDRCRQQGELHLVLADNGGEGKRALPLRCARLFPLRRGRRPPGSMLGQHIHHAAFRRLNSDQVCDRASTRCSISASECSGVGVIRSRSVPRATVG